MARYFVVVLLLEHRASCYESVRTALRRVGRLFLLDTSCKYVYLDGRVSRTKRNAVAGSGPMVDALNVKK